MPVRTEQEILDFINAEARRFKESPGRERNLAEEIKQNHEIVWFLIEGHVKRVFGEFYNKNTAKVVFKLRDNGYIRLTKMNGIIITEVGYNKIGHWTL